MSRVTVVFSGSFVVNSEDLVYQHVESDRVISHDEYLGLSEQERDNYCMMSFTDAMESSDDVSFEELSVIEEGDLVVEEDEVEEIEVA